MDLPPCYFQMLSLSANVTELILDRNTERLTEEEFSRPSKHVSFTKTSSFQCICSFILCDVFLYILKSNFVT